jgi:hypothetical protein
MDACLLAVASDVKRLACGQLVLIVVFPAEKA